MSKKIYEYQLAGRKITVEYGEVAKKDDEAVLVRFEETVLLSVS